MLRPLLSAVLLQALLNNSAIQVKAVKWPLRAPHRDAVPSSFDCAMRKLAYEYGRNLIPRHPEFMALYYALDLGLNENDSNSDDCHVDLEKVQREVTKKQEATIARRSLLSDFNEGCLGKSGDPAVNRKCRSIYQDAMLDRPDDPFLYLKTKKKQKAQSDFSRGCLADASPVRVTSEACRRIYENALLGLPEDAVFVTWDDAKHNSDYDTPKGSSDRQFLDIQQAIDHAAQKTTSKHVVLRGGTYYLDNTIYLTSKHNGLTLTALPGETPVLSGGTLLDVMEWKPYKVDDTTNIWVTNLRQTNPNLKDMPGLHINGKRATRARYPNLPGGIEVSCGYGCMINEGFATWTPPQFDKFGNSTYYTDADPNRTRPNGGWFEHYNIGVHGLCSVYDPPVSYWCSEHPSGGGAFAFRTPSGLTPINHTILPNGPYHPTNTVEDAVVFVWRPQRWANWMFHLEEYSTTTGNMTFGIGGNQGARGENKGGDWFIENLLEELDHPNEYYFDKRTSDLYLYYNGTGAPPPSTQFVVPHLRTILNVTGTQQDPAKDIFVQGIQFRDTRYTYMDPHGVPSGGDWALERNAAVFLQGTERSTINQCTLERLDGNGLMISGYNRNTTIHECDFAYIGSTAIASWGFTNETDTDPGRPGVHLENAPSAGVDMTDGEHPRHNWIEGCTAREVGLYEKQSSFYMQAKTIYSTLKGNAFFNGPRAGINLNDGSGGGDEISHNLVFSTCRESGDHGPFNSWDRQPFLTLKDNDPTPSMGAEWREIHHNFFIDNYSPQENVDNDDGSAYFKTHDNFFVYGYSGQKNDYGGHDNHHYGNIYAYVQQALGICEQLEGHEDVFANNKVVTTGNNVGGFKCQGPGKTILHGNEYYTESGNILECGMNLTDWQKQGNDVNSTVSKLPSDDTILDWARSLLSLQQ